MIRLTTAALASLSLLAACESCRESARTSQSTHAAVVDLADCPGWRNRGCEHGPEFRDQCDAGYLCACAMVEKCEGPR